MAEEKHISRLIEIANTGIAKPGEAPSLGSQLKAIAELSEIKDRTAEDYVLSLAEYEKKHTNSKDDVDAWTEEVIFVNANGPLKQKLYCWKYFSDYCCSFDALPTELRKNGDEGALLQECIDRINARRCS